MSRISVPVAKLSGSVTAGGVLTHKVAAVSAPRHAKRLGGRSSNGQSDAHARSLTVAHRPPDRSSLASPLTRAFTTTSSPRARLDTSTIDYMVFPTAQSPSDALPEVSTRMPLLPDNFLARHSPDQPDGPLTAPEIVVIAADPTKVVPAALTEVEGIGVDGVELKFAHERAVGEKEPGMLRDLWKGLVDDVLGEGKLRAA